jgi:hypothetical protein
MSRYQFELVTEADDADLRHVLAATPMDGRIRVAFCREPSYFGGAAIDGQFRQTIACRDTDSGRIVGFGSRSVADRYVNGAPRPIGYLSALRLLPEHRNRGLVARGYAHLRRLHLDDQRTILYLTTIAEENQAALAALTAGRAGLPAYHEAGWYCTMAIPAGRRLVARQSEFSGTIRPASPRDLPLVVDFLKQYGPLRQFFPCYEADDLFANGGIFKGLSAGDLWLALAGDRLVGTMAAWDQLSFRQSMVQGYSGAIQYARPLYNAWSRVRGLPPLPAIGKPFRSLMGALPVIADNCAVVFRALLAVLRRRAAETAFEYLLVGLHESDPLFEELKRLRGVEYRTRLFLVCWDDGEVLRESLDGRPPYLELGCL